MTAKPFGLSYKEKVRENRFSNFSYLSLKLVGPTREKLNYIFSDIQVLCERLDELDIEAIMEAEDE